MENANKVFESFLRQKGLKLTIPREIVLDVVLTQNKHFDVDSVYEKIRRKYKNVSRATIYRTIPLLIEAGFIKKVLPCYETDCYETIFNQPNHLHFICVKCGKITEMPSAELEKIYSELAKGIGFKIFDYNFGAKGICKECQKKE